MLAVIQVQTPTALVNTAYGKLLLIKLGLLVFLFTLAAVNRWKLTASAEAGATEVQRRLARSIGVEMLIVLAIFGVAAGWRFTPPPRALAIAAAEPASVHMHALQAMADLSITPGHAGPVVASMIIMTGDFGPLDAKEVTLVLSKPVGIGAAQDGGDQARRMQLACRQSRHPGSRPVDGCASTFWFRTSRW